MTEPLPPTTNPQSPPVLNYAGPTRAQRHASGGLMLMGGGLILLAIVMATQMVINFGHFWHEAIFPLLIALAIFACGAVYLVSAVNIHRDNTKLAIFALSVLLVQTAGLLCISVFGMYEWWQDDDGSALPLTIFVALVNIGLGSVIFELCNVIRESRLRVIKSGR